MVTQDESEVPWRESETLWAAIEVAAEIVPKEFVALEGGWQRGVL